MNLQKRLTEIRNAFETGGTPRESIEILNEHIESLLTADVSSKALRVGDQAPLDLTVRSLAGKKPLSSFLTDKFLVLTWFRGNW